MGSGDPPRAACTVGTDDQFRRPGVIAMAPGNGPTVIGGAAVLLRMLIGVTVPESIFAT
jgi:hypothetical protein